MKNLYLIPIALMISVLLIAYDITPAFADVEITVITPTGGALDATSDCSGIGAQNHIIWMDCNDVLYAISEDSNAVLANATVGASGAVIFSTVSGTNVLWVDVSTNAISKYTYNSGLNTVTLTGTLTPASCDLIGRDSFQYDTLGFVWSVCNGEDKIFKFNPSTMTSVQTSQDLTDGAGLECGSPTKVAFGGQTGDIGVIRCALPSVRIVTFEIATSSTITLLDDEIQANIASESLMIDVNNDRIFAVDSADFEVFSYTSGGILSTGQIISGNTFDQCVNEPFETNGASDFATFQVCMYDTGVAVGISAFMSNSTGNFQILNTVAQSTSTDAITIRFADNQAPLNVLVPIFYINSDSNNQKYVKITGVRTASEQPEPPSGGGGGGAPSGGGVDCTLPQNQNKVACRVDENGALAGSGSYIIGNTTSDTGMIAVFCQIGIVDCAENPDMKTNGAGLIFTMIALAVMVGILWVASRGDLGSVPVFIWLIGTLLIVGFATIADLIDATVLIIAVVAIIALATAKLRGLFGGEFK